MSGYKSYAIMVVAIIYAASSFFTGHIDANTAVELVLAALGLGSLRRAVTTEVSKIG